MNLKCYNKRLEYVVPTIRCDFCKTHIKSGDELYSVVLTWGNGKTSCKECYDKFEIDWSLHEIETSEDE